MSEKEEQPDFKDSSFVSGKDFLIFHLFRKIESFQSSNSKNTIQEIKKILDEKVSNSRICQIKGDLLIRLIIFREKYYKGDIDNLVKTILDSLKGYAYCDDNQIKKVVAIKEDASEPYNLGVYGTLTIFNKELDSMCVPIKYNRFKSEELRQRYLNSRKKNDKMRIGGIDLPIEYFIVDSRVS